MPTQNLLVSGADVYDEKLVNPALFGPHNNGWRGEGGSQPKSDDTK